MTPLPSALLALLDHSSPAERQAWLAYHAPKPDYSLLEALRAEAERRERIDPRTIEPVEQLIAAAAALWGDQATGAVACLIRANCLRLLGEQEQALTNYRQAIAYYQQLGLHLDAARTAVGMIDVLTNLGRYPEALTLAAATAHKLRTADDQATLAKLLVNQGNLYARQKAFADAQQSYIEARRLFQAIGNRQQLAAVLANEAMVCLEVDQYTAAEELFDQAHEHFAAAGMLHALALVDHSRAHLALAQGDYQRALIIANQARVTLLAQESPIDIALLDLDRAEIYLALNLWQEALTLARQTRPTFDHAGMVHESAQLRLNEAMALAQLDQSRAAMAALEEARRLFTQVNQPIWLAIVDLYQAQIDKRTYRWRHTRQRAERAFPVFWKAGLLKRAAECQLLLGEVALAKQKLQLAEAAFYHAQQLFAATAVPAVIAYASAYGLARVFQAQGQYGAAQQYFQQAIVALEQLQATIGAEDYKLAFRRDKVQVYERLLVLLLQIQTADIVQLAFQTSERARTRTLLDVMARNAVLTRPAPSVASQQQTDSQSLVAEIAHHKQALHWYYNRLNQTTSTGDNSGLEQRAAIMAAITQQEAQLSQLFNRWRKPDLIAAPENPIATVTPAQLQGLLPPDALFLAYYMLEKQIIVWGVTQTDLWQKELTIPRARLKELLEQLRFHLSKFHYGSHYRQRHAEQLARSGQSILQQLYTELVQPLADQLTASTIIIAPHDLLHYVPFHALWNGHNYWFATTQISYAPSATLLHQLATKEVRPHLAPPAIFGLADERLPYIAAELDALATLFPSAPLYINEAANTAAFLTLTQQSAFLHLATHATFRQDNPSYSAFELVDGWVTVNDLYGLDHFPPLVTLSACETGRAAIEVGDELMGLCRGFFSAGVHALVVSLWTVDDLATAELMGNFYRRLRDGQPVGAALHDAQRETMHKWHHPYYWAPFFLIGDPWLRLPNHA